MCGFGFRSLATSYAEILPCASVSIVSSICTRRGWTDYQNRTLGTGGEHMTWLGYMYMECVRKWLSSYFMGMLFIMVTSSEIVIENCARFSTVTQILFKIEKTRRNQLCLSWLSDIYGRVEHSVYKIRLALRTLKVIGVKKWRFP